MKLKMLLVGLILISLTKTINAQSLPTNNRFNIGTDQKPDIRACFNLENYKMLLIMNNEYNINKEKIHLLNDKFSLENQILEEQKKQLITLQSEKDRIYNLWATTDQKLHDAENKPSKSNWFLWTAVIVLSSVSLVTTGMLIK